MPYAAAEAQARLDHPAEGPRNADKRDADKRYQEKWVAKLINEADEVSASIPNLPPSQRQDALRWAASLKGVADDVLNGESMPGLRPLNRRPGLISPSAAA